MSETVTPETDQAPKRRVKFGPKPTQTVPFEWAETILTELAQREPHHFGRYLQFAALGEMPPDGRRARGSGAQ
jgi:hypothetical protein